LKRSRDGKLSHPKGYGLNSNSIVTRIKDERTTPPKGKQHWWQWTRDWWNNEMDIFYVGVGSSMNLSQLSTLDFWWLMSPNPTKDMTHETAICTMHIGNALLIAE
jgi:hypothetical protein